MTAGLVAASLCLFLTASEPPNAPSPAEIHWLVLSTEAVTDLAPIAGVPRNAPGAQWVEALQRKGWDAEVVGEQLFAASPEALLGPAAAFTAEMDALLHQRLGERLANQGWVTFVLSDLSPGARKAAETNLLSRSNNPNFHRSVLDGTARMRASILFNFEIRNGDRVVASSWRARGPEVPLLPSEAPSGPPRPQPLAPQHEAVGPLPLRPSAVVSVTPAMAAMTSWKAVLEPLGAWLDERYRARLAGLTADQRQAVWDDRRRFGLDVSAETVMGTSLPPYVRQVLLERHEEIPGFEKLLDGGVVSFRRPHVILSVEYGDDRWAGLPPYAWFMRFGP